jgi:hypothetical protein
VRQWMNRLDAYSEAVGGARGRTGGSVGSSRLRLRRTESLRAEVQLFDDWVSVYSNGSATKRGSVALLGLRSKGKGRSKATPFLSTARWQHRETHLCPDLM